MSAEEAGPKDELTEKATCDAKRHRLHEPPAKGRHYSYVAVTPGARLADRAKRIRVSKAANGGAWT